MTMPRWKNGKLDLGKLGELWVRKHDLPLHQPWYWLLVHEDATVAIVDPRSYESRSSAQNAAVLWLREAIKQANARLGEAPNKPRDDTKKVQGYIDAGAGIPPGVYNISKPLTVRSGTSVAGVKRVRKARPAKRVRTHYPTAGCEPGGSAFDPR